MWGAVRFHNPTRHCCATAGESLPARLERADETMLRSVLPQTGLSVPAMWVTIHPAACLLARVPSPTRHEDQSSSERGLR